MKNKKERTLVTDTTTPQQWPCTACGGDATIAYTARGTADWGGLVRRGERLCLACGRRRGIGFFGAPAGEGR